MDHESHQPHDATPEPIPHPAPHILLATKFLLPLFPHEAVTRRHLEDPAQCLLQRLLLFR